MYLGKFRSFRIFHLHKHIHNIIRTNDKLDKQQDTVTSNYNIIISFKTILFMRRNKVKRQIHQKSTNSGEYEVKFFLPLGFEKPALLYSGADG